ncbi:hypothetical protein BDV41DRAFT_550439 [Aspergillus transmontanensis]|uniref:Uncharacterized protein n=1 Tax=Aspergillus transmontanensis TaxID=1034304 RepID=A0A5N6VJM9_9EURO|nr:hypothetical protein BDV41DRAFT_550439 [Aspergillus transmontanensis]
MGSRSRPRILEWLRTIEVEPGPFGTPRWSLPSHNFPKVQDIYGKIPGIEDQLRRPTSVMCTEDTVREGNYLESEGPVPCLMSSQKVTSKKGRSGYERRPRYKTKDNHYEYKGKTSHEKDDRVTKTKRRRSAKKSRKHTMNDNFHASNVARDRLTLQSNMNLGLFQMGRASSPVKVQGADLSFSEMKFLSNKARKDREAACIYRGKEENGSVCWNSPNQNLRTCSPLLNTVDQRARRQASDVFPYEISVYEHGQRSTMPRTYPNASSQHRHEGSDGMSRAATAYTSPESAREYSPLDDRGEWCARQLLSIDLDVQDQNEAIATIKSTRKYWSLEELKYLLDQRKLLWDSDTYSPVVSTNESSHWRSLKRKRPLSIGEGEPAQTLKMTKTHNSKNNAEYYGVIGIPVPNHHDPASEPPALLRSSGDTDGVSMHILHGQSAPASPQAFEQADIVEPPTSDFTLYPGKSSFISSSLHNQKPKSVMQSHYSCGLKEVKSSTTSEMIWDYEESPAQFANRAMPLPREDCALIAQTLSAAYDVIMHSGQDPLYQIPKHLMLDTPMRDASSGVGGNGNIFPVADDYHGLPEGLAFYRLLGVASDTGTFSHGSSDFAEQKRSLGLSQPNYAGQLQYFTGQFPEARYSAGETPEVIMAGTESKPTAAIVSGLQEDLLGGLKGFWRQQKLY